MQFLRKLALVIALIIYAPLLLVLPTVLSLNATLNKPTFIKATVAEAGVYQALSKYILEQSAKSPEISQSEIAAKTFQEVFTPDAIQQVFEPTVDSVYKWLDNPSDEFDISVPIKPLQEKFKQKVDENFAEHLATLPKCTSRTSPTTTDPFKYTCIPPGLSIDDLRAQAQVQLAQNPGLSEQESFSLTNPEKNQTCEETSQATAEAPRLDVDSFKTVAKVYRITKASTPYIIGLLILSTIAILTLSRPWVKGLKKVGVFLIVNGVLLLVTWGITGTGLRIFLPVPATDGSLGVAGRQVVDLMSQHMLMMSRNFAIAYVVIGIISVIAATILKKKLYPGDAKPSIEKDDMLPKDDNLDDKPTGPKPVQKAPEPKAAPKTEDKKSTKISINSQDEDK